MTERTATEQSAWERLQEHERLPQNMGRMGDAQATGNVGSIVVGKALRFFMTVDQGTISAAKFQVFSCQEMIATASVITEMVTGMSLAQAYALSTQDITAHLGGLNALDLPPSIWGLEGLKDAIRQCDDSIAMPSVDSHKEGLICRCHGITESAIRHVVKEQDCEDFDDLRQFLPAGTGCGTCRRDIQGVIDSMLEKARVASMPQAKAISVQGRIGMMHKIQESLQGQLDEAQQAGHSCSLWDLKGVEIEIRVPAALPDQDQWAARAAHKIQDDVDPSLTVVLSAVE